MPSRGCEHLDNLNARNEKSHHHNQERHDIVYTIRVTGPGQAVDGKGPDLQLWGANIDEQEERDGWPEGGEDPVQKVGWRLVGVAVDQTTEADVAVVIWEGGRRWEKSVISVLDKESHDLKVLAS